MARVSREMIVTEKIDGTNAQILITDDGDMFTGSRSRWITPEDDNFGFARWAQGNKEQLMKLGAGKHFGEWWGAGIQRGYGLPKGEKRFSLFNALRWVPCGGDVQEKQEMVPEGVYVVPVLYRGMFDTAMIVLTLEHLKNTGSQASKGFMKPEGVVAFHVAGNFGLKKTIEKDESPKGQS